MLDHADTGAVFLQHGAQAGFGHQIITGGNLRGPQIGADKKDALPGGRGGKSHGHRHTGMQGNAGRGDRLADGMTDAHAVFINKKSGARAPLFSQCLAD